MKITAPTESELLPLEVNIDQFGNVQKQEEGKFICSPAYILVCRRVGLQDAKVNEKIQNNFCNVNGSFTFCFVSF